MPPCLYFSPAEIALDEKMPWDGLQPDQRSLFEKRFEAYLARYNQKLERIAEESGILTVDLLGLMKEQFNLGQVLPSSARNILFPS